MGMVFWIYMFARSEIIRLFMGRTSYSLIREILHSKKRHMNMDLIFRVFQHRQLFLITTWMGIWICIFLTIRYILHAAMVLQLCATIMIPLQVTGYTEMTKSVENGFLVMLPCRQVFTTVRLVTVSYTHLRAHET